MIQVDCPEPSAHVSTLLQQRKQKGTKWNSRNPSRIAADAEINTTLQQAFSGKCGYCESIEAKTIDHFWPQSRYEQHVWDWDNFILACHVCQGHKAEHSPLNENGFQMINPREEEPLRYLRINTLSGKLSALCDSAEKEQRGKYTLSTLGLDQRPELDRERLLVYKSLLYFMVQIVDPDVPAISKKNAWNHMREFLDKRRPYVAIIQQIFTIPPKDIQPIIEKLYEVIPESYAFFARFRRIV